MKKNKNSWAIQSTSSQGHSSKGSSKDNVRGSRGSFQTRSGYSSMNLDSLEISNGKISVNISRADSMF